MATKPLSATPCTGASGVIEPHWSSPTDARSTRGGRSGSRHTFSTGGSAADPDRLPLPGALRGGSADRPGRVGAALESQPGIDERHGQHGARRLLHGHGLRELARRPPDAWSRRTRTTRVSRSLPRSQSPALRGTCLLLIEKPCDCLATSTSPSDCMASRERSDLAEIVKRPDGGRRMSGGAGVPSSRRRPRSPSPQDRSQGRGGSTPLEGQHEEERAKV